MTVPVPANVVNLSASATVEVAMDWLSIAFATTREGADAAAVQAGLRQALDAALAEARKLASPGQVEVRTGNFALHPRYGAPSPRNPNQPTITGWVGSAELIVEGRDQAAIAGLSARITSLAIARVGQSLSREAREKVEADVAAQAIARFRDRAAAVSRQFGFSGYSLREVAVSTGGEGMPEPQAMMMAKAGRLAMADESLPVAAGKAAVTASVSGSVQMTK
jgi:predicted secreted protein